ncbi:hypothetical protein [Alkalibacter mobilis]|uniref:hypothetical protein n=1 Tax=Alkalibacter mobilis TaxID=2787712 RepID=UPI00189E1D06|nr:hypothetical protein [Alkalibacter mobilis]MBF7097594.1 hypothetical protein [Alkalibacter mobilis]
MIFLPGETVKFVYEGNKLKKERFKSETEYTVVKQYKHYVLCISSKGYRESFFQDEIRRA